MLFVRVARAAFLRAAETEPARCILARLLEPAPQAAQNHAKRPEKPGGEGSRPQHALKFAALVMQTGRKNSAHDGDFATVMCLASAGGGGKFDKFDL